MNLRYYQENIVTDSRRAYAEGARAPLVCSPTGSGKTVITSYITQGAIEKGRRSWIIAHRKELITQSSATLSKFGIPHGLVKAGMKQDLSPLAQVCSIQSLIARHERMPSPDFILIDECHHAVSGSYRTIIDRYPQAKLLGFTATPSRLDGRGLGEVFDRIIMGPSVLELMMEGYLSPARYYAPPKKVDLTGVPRRRGDFATKQLEAAMNRPTITGDAVAHYAKFCDGAPALVFCVSVPHAEEVAAAYRAAGYRAASVDGSLPDAVRDERINGLANGTYQVITSCDLIGEGLDVPIVTAAQLLRPTDSLILHLQQIGRVLRPADGKDHAVILDHVGNLQRHGFAETSREWSLDPITKRNVNAAEPVRECPQCFAAFQPAPACPFCGFEFPVDESKSRKIKEEEGSLSEVKDEEKQAQMKKRRMEEGACRSFEDFVELGERRGYRSPRGWARHRARARGFAYR